jgi:hypothetical protein
MVKLPLAGTCYTVNYYKAHYLVGRASRSSIRFDGTSNGAGALSFSHTLRKG